MLKRILGLISLFLVILVVSACASQAIASTQVKAQVDGDKVTVAASDVQNSQNTRFPLLTPAGNEYFMVYKLGDSVYARASVCPPCRSTSFTLKGETLVCDRCGTVFNAKTGAGIQGACVNYPKASVPYTVADGKIAMNMSDLATAYKNTLEPGAP
jgi:nitrite reductase/ring-hydroxylating ferredoxin subunit